MLPKTVLFPKVPYKEFSSAGPGSIFQFLAFWAFMSFHFGLLGLHFLSFWPFGPSFPFILALWAFISFHFGLLGLHFLSFWSCGPSFPFILAFWAFISLHFGFLVASLWGPHHKLPKTVRFPKVPYKEFSSVRLGSIFQFLAVISFHFGLLGLHFLSFWPFGPSFPFILAFWVFISFDVSLVGLDFLC